MADRVSVAIRIGGVLPPGLLEPFHDAVDDDGAAIDWEGTPFTNADITGTSNLYLVANEVAWGRFEQLETFCQLHHLPFTRWSGGASGSFGPERIVYDGTGDPRYFCVSDDDEVLVSRDKIRQLGTIEAVEAYFEAAELVVPPFSLAEAAATEGEQPPHFSFTRWRHGGWYVHGVHYPSGAIGCVSRNYTDGKWRIVCDPRPFEERPTYSSRELAARAEWELARSQTAE